MGCLGGGKVDENIIDLNCHSARSSTDVPCLITAESNIIIICQNALLIPTGGWLKPKGKKNDDLTQYSTQRPAGGNNRVIRILLYGYDMKLFLYWSCPAGMLHCSPLALFHVAYWSNKARLFVCLSSSSAVLPLCVSADAFNYFTYPRA